MSGNVTVNGNESGKLAVAAGVIVLAFIGMILGIRFNKPVFGTFSAGTWMTFIAFLLSLGAARDRHSNALPITAFCFSFGAMCATAFVSAL